MLYRSPFRFHEACSAVYHGTAEPGLTAVGDELIYVYPNGMYDIVRPFHSFGTVLS